MINSSIENIHIKLDDNQEIIAKPNMFDNLYISQINSSGDEVAFIQQDNHYLKANFFIIKLSNKIIEYNISKNLKKNAFNLFKKDSKIKEVIIDFKNGNTQPFCFAKDNNLFVKKNNNELYLLFSEYNIKYKENLFA